MKRVFWAALLLFSFAWAAGCEDYDVTLEVEKPPLLLGGAEFELNGAEMVFSGGACISGGFGTLTAQTITYDRQRARLRAEGVSGEVNGWLLRAPLLSGDAEVLQFERPLLERGDTSLEAGRAELRGETVFLSALEARTPRFRFFAARGSLHGDGFLAEEVWGTPCKCGRALELLAHEAEFAFSGGRLYLRRANLRAYGLDLWRPQSLLVELNEPLDLSFPLRFSYGGGWNFGVERLPLPQAGEAFGRWSTHLTLQAEGVGGAVYAGKTESLTLALDYRGEDGRFHFGLKPRRRWSGGVWESWLEPDVYLERGPLRYGIGWDRRASRQTAYTLLSQSYAVGPWRVSPYFRLAAEAAYAGLAAGASGSLTLFDYKTGGFSLGLNLPHLLALYPDAAPYAWGGARLRVGYGGLASLEAEFDRAYGAPRYSYEARAGREKFSLRLGKSYWARASFGRSAVYDLGAGAVGGYTLAFSAAAGWRDAKSAVSLSWRRSLKADAAMLLTEGADRWQARLKLEGHELSGEWNTKWDAAGTLSRSEVWFSYRPPLADCAGGWRLMPSLGYDLLGGGLSRAGLELDLNDCCFTWSLVYRGVFDAAAAAAAAGQTVSFGVNIR